MPPNSTTTAVPDQSDIRTWIGPRPPSRPHDCRTFIWSRCSRCTWYACHLEDSRSMQHTIEVFDHARSDCVTAVQLALLAH
jgi:hypothetical protein